MIFQRAIIEFSWKQSTGDINSPRNFTDYNNNNNRERERKKEKRKTHLGIQLSSGSQNICFRKEIFVATLKQSKRQLSHNQHSQLN